MTERTVGGLGQAAGEIGSGLFLGFVNRAGFRFDKRAQIYGGRKWCVAAGVHVQFGELHHALAVGDRVVDLHEERTATVVQSVDDHEQPKRSRPVEGVLEEAGAEGMQLLEGSGFRKGEVPDMEVEIELMVGYPRRW